MLHVQEITVTTTGTNGSATGNGYSSRPINGEVRAIYVDWSSSAPAGTSDIAITIEADDDRPAVTLYSKANSVTDAWVYPSIQRTGTDGANIAAQYQNVVAQGRVKVAVTDCDALAAAVVVYVYVWE
jgi:hypothetical protein